MASHDLELVRNELRSIQARLTELERTVGSVQCVDTVERLVQIEERIFALEKSAPGVDDDPTVVSDDIRRLFETDSDVAVADPEDDVGV